MTDEADTVLLVSNEPDETAALRSFLAGAGAAVHVTSAAGAIQALALRSYGIVMADVGLPGTDGVALARRALELDQRTRVLLITHPGAKSELIEALSFGVADYVTTPLVAKELERKLRRLREPAPVELGGSTLVVESRAMKTVVSRAARACAVELPVFLSGELGAGRKTIARAVHRFGATRAEPFLTLNFKSIPAHLMASELFGSRPLPGDGGGHPGILAAAGRGAVMLENVDAMSSAVQLKLIGALDAGMIHPLGPSLDARIFCASDRDLEMLVAKGIFESGLYHRLNALRLSIPPLRERAEDVLALAVYFLRNLAEETGERVPLITDEALAALRHYAWPANVRELENVMERALVLADGAVRLRHLPPEVASVTVPLRPGPRPPEPRTS